MRSFISVLLANITVVIKLRKTRWAGRDMAHMGEMMSAYRILVGNLTKTDHCGEIGIDGSMT
jgi:hypothetical protein